MLRSLRPAIVMILGFTLITGLAYPLAVTGVARLVFPAQAGGSLVIRKGEPVGSTLIGQAFTSERYFHSRPSATAEPDPNDPSKTVSIPYDASSSGGSNLAPTAKALVDRVSGDVATLKVENPGTPIPADLVTTSASGLDPDISPAAASFQVARIARARDLAPERVQALVAAHTEGRLLGLIGEPHVNVLALNLALDNLK